MGKGGGGEEKGSSRGATEGGDACRFDGFADEGGGGWKPIELDGGAAIRCAGGGPGGGG